MNIQVFLCALALVESGNDDLAWNRHSGARGRYQFTRTAWKQHTVLPFTYAHDHRESNLRAMQHVDWLKANGVPDKPYDLAYAWHCGLKGYKRDIKNPFPKYMDHASRVQAIYNLALSDPTALKPAKKARRR